MNSKLIWLSLAALFSCALAEKFSFEGYKLYHLFPETDAHIDLIAQLEHNPDFDLWSRVREGVLKVSLAPTVLKKYETIFQLFKLRYEIVHNNIQEIFEEEQREMSKRDVSDGRIAGRYASHPEINAFILSKVDNYPNIASSYIAGKSTENKDMRVMVLKTATSRRNIWIDCGIHAREWASPASCVWIIDKLTTEYAANNAITVALLNYFEIHILPVVNPDGYEWSRTDFRMWRKNRKRNSGSTCIGVDLNRNYGFQWMTGGSSSSPCSDTYAGPSADSESETKAVQAAINAAPGKWDSFLTIHSYGKWWFTPYGYTAATLPSDYTDLNDKAKIGVQALQAVYKETGWTTGSSSQILYVASGGSEDWAYGTAKIKYSYCLELRPGQDETTITSGNGNGFTLPESKAPLAGEETYQGVKAFLNAIKP